jgi:putative oxidoreductase
MTARWAGASWARRTEEVADLPVRLALGGAMLYHGLQKLRGEGPAQTAAMFEAMRLTPSRTLALATGVAETAAGALAILGIATRPAALAVLVTQGVAIWKVHAPKGYDVMKGGMEYNLALVSIALALLTGRPGAISAHRVLAGRRTRGITGLAALLRRDRPVLDRALAAIH